MLHIGQYFIEYINELVGGRQAIEYMVLAKNDYKNLLTHCDLLKQDATNSEEDSSANMLEYSKVNRKLETQACKLNKLLSDMEGEFQYFEKVNSINL